MYFFFFTLQAAMSSEEMGEYKSYHRKGDGGKNITNQVEPDL